MRRRSKYGNKKTEYDGYKFDSIIEKDRYKVLIKKQEEGLIKDLQLQKKYLLQDKFKYRGKTVRAIHYIADFYYIENDVEVIEDVKGGILTADFKLKQKLFKYRYQDIHFKVIIKRQGKWVNLEEK